AEALRVTAAPFVIVEERPGEVATDVDALVHCRAHGAQVVGEIAHAHGIFDPPRGGYHVVQRAAVLRDIQRWGAVALLHPHQDAREAFGIDLPAGRRVL